MNLRWAAAAVPAAALVVVLAGGAVGGAVGVVTAAAPTAGVSTPAVTAPGGARILLGFDQEVVPATLADTAPAREFAGMLPLELELRDPMGQAKSGRLPGPIDNLGADTVADPAVGEIYYWPGSATIAILYDDLGQSVPPPGLVRLGTVDRGVDAIAGAGNRILLRIDLVDRADS